MELSELTAYAREKYQIEEQFKWADFPGFSVLCHPHTGKWVALLMRQWDSETGTTLECCDLKCGSQSLAEFRKPFLTAPVRMHGQKWINASFTEETEPEIIFRLFDRAVSSGDQHGYTIALDDTTDQATHTEPIYQSTPLDFSGYRSVRTGNTDNSFSTDFFRKQIEDLARYSGFDVLGEPVPEQIREMRRLYEDGRPSLAAKAQNFYRQGMFMQDYEDDVSYPIMLTRYFPTYHDLNNRNLRSYFTWRTGVRKGEYHPMTTSVAYLYVYELLNGIGASSPEDTLEKLEAFETGFLESGIGDIGMRQNLQRWKKEYAIVKGLPVQTVQLYVEAELAQKDTSLSVLRQPEDHTDEEILSALRFFDEKRFLSSPILQAEDGNGRHLFCEAWRTARKNYHSQNKDLFTLCFGNPMPRPWHPLANAIYHWADDQPKNVEYVLNDCRSYRCQDGAWQVIAYQKLYYDQELFRGFLRETDRMLRRYLKAGRPLKKNKVDEWADPYIGSVIETDRRIAEEAARPKITVDLSRLDRIRKDALITQDSLLVEDDLPTADYANVISEAMAQEVPASGIAPVDNSAALPLDPMHFRILCLLLKGEPVQDLLRTHHLMPSLVADSINEVLYEEIGDTVLLCEQDVLSLVEDYREDLEQLLGQK